MRRIAIAFALTFATGAVAAAEFSSLEERMSSSEFKGAGLDKLSPQELGRLNAWLRQHGLTAAGAAATAATPDAGFRPRGFFGGAEPGPVSGHIVGEFKGWGHKTHFKLDNGQEWQQTDDTTFDVPAMQNPGVTIEPAALGSWQLKVEGYNRSVKVIRVK